jgi:hypothetical protein
VNPAVDRKKYKQGKTGSKLSPRSALAVGRALPVHSILPSRQLIMPSAREKCSA